MYYRKRPQSSITRSDDEYYGPEDQIVFDIKVEDSPDRFTGLVDPEGYEIFQSDRVPLGFLARMDEEDDTG